jgi:cytochrome b
MSTTLNQPSLSVATPIKSPVSTRRVSDAATRAFHWLFAFSFLGAYLTADFERLRGVHVALGYTMLGLLAFESCGALWVQACPLQVALWQAIWWPHLA